METKEVILQVATGYGAQWYAQKKEDGGHCLVSARSAATRFPCLANATLWIYDQIGKGNTSYFVAWPA